jgi:uncharacterized membrane protein
MNMRVSRTKFLILIIMSVIGLLAASEVIITYNIMKGTPPFCKAGSIGGISLDCEAVLGSKYSEIFGVPLELFAVVYFVINLFLVYLVSFGSDSIFGRALGILFAWRFVGLMIVPYLVFIELFVLKAVCIYCTTMHAAIIADFIVISYFLFFGKNALWAKMDAAELSTSGMTQPLK